MVLKMSRNGDGLAAHLQVCTINPLASPSCTHASIEGCYVSCEIVVDDSRSLELTLPRALLLYAALHGYIA